MNRSVATRIADLTNIRTAWTIKQGNDPWHPMNQSVATRTANLTSIGTTRTVKPGNEQRHPTARDPGYTDSQPDQYQNCLDGQTRQRAAASHCAAQANNGRCPMNGSVATRTANLTSIGTVSTVKRGNDQRRPTVRPRLTTGGAL